MEFYEYRIFNVLYIDMNFMFISNFGYLFSSFISFYKKKYNYSFLLSLLFIVSILYHTNRKYLYIDFILSNLVLYYSIKHHLHNKNNWNIKIICIILLSLMIISILGSGKYGTSNYNNIHPYAHIFGGIATILTANSLQ